MEGIETIAILLLWVQHGVGKSTVAKHLILNEYMRGTKIIIIDPEREYKFMTNKLGGNWINVAGSKNVGKINPLQIRPAPLEEDTELEDSKISELSLHIQTLRTFFRLLFSDITSIQMTILEEVIEEMYNKFAITWDTDISKLSNTDFPIMSDLYKLLEIKINKLIKDNKECEDYKIILSMIRQIAVGADSNIFNGYTSIEEDSNIICLDIFSLQSADDNIKRAQYFNVLSYCWQMLSKNKTEKVLLVCDEAYNLISPTVSQSISFLRNVAKRARKYEGALAIISHSVVDFLDSSVKLYGQAILDMASFKILMGTDGKNLAETQELYNLTEAESDFLYARKRANALLMVGTNRIKVRFDLFSYESDYFGSGGGR